MALIILLVAITMTLIGFVSGRYSMGRANGKAALNRLERAELDHFREMSDELLDQALERIETEPFAAVILDQIRAHQRKRLA